MTDDPLVRPVGEADNPRATPTPEADPLIEDAPRDTAGEVDIGDGPDDPGEQTDERQGATTEDKLKRERAARKRAERKAREVQDQLAALTSTVAELAKRQGNVEQHTLSQAEQDLKDRYEQARTAKRVARENGDIDAEERADEAIYALRRQAETLAARKQQRRPAQDGGRQAQSQVPQPRSELAADWASEQSHWFGRDPLATQMAMRVSAQLERRGIHPDDPRHFQTMNTELARHFPEHYEDQDVRPSAQQRPRPGQTVAGSSRSAPGGGARLPEIPAAALEAYRIAGHPVDDPKWREEKRRQHGAQWAKSGVR